MAIKIFCDLCGQEKPASEIKGVEAGKCSADFMAPRMDHRHFACAECLSKIGIVVNDAKILKEALKEISSALKDEAVKSSKTRRRGVEVVLTWKNNGEFEVFNSIAAACDRIAEKTGAAISGADISHALLKERVYNSNAFTVRYANNGQSGQDGQSGQAADGSAAGKEIHEFYVSQNAPDELKHDCELPAIFATNDVSTAANAEKAAGE